MSLAAETREAVRSRPFMFEALRAGIVNYAAAARLLAVSDDTEAVATALRRFANELPDRNTHGVTDVRITMQGGIEITETNQVLSVGDTGYGIGSGEYTGIQVTGAFAPRSLGDSVNLLAINDIPIEALGMIPSHLLVIVTRRHGATALRYIESVFEPSAG